MGKISDRIADSVLLYVERNWPQPLVVVSGVLVLTATTACATLSLWKSLDLPVEFKWHWTGGLCLVAAVVSGIIGFRAWAKHKTPKDCVGIVLVLAADSEEQHRELRTEFIASFRQLIKEATHAHSFEILVAPRRLAEELSDGADERVLRYFSERRGHLLIFGSVKPVDLGQGRMGRHLALKGYVRHAPVAQVVSKELAIDMTQVFPHRLLLVPEGRLFQFEAASEWLDLATRYVVGVAAMISGDLEYAETLLLDVEMKTKTARQLRSNSPSLRQLEKRVPERLIGLYVLWLHALNAEYFRTRRTQLLPRTEDVADRLLARDPSHYGAKMAKALCCFALRRDTRNARRIISTCKRNADAAWRYSEAFLLAYSGKLTRAHEEYDRAFRARTNDLTLPVQCEEFIQMVLDAEPHQGQLHFCAAVINCFAKDDSAAAKRDFESFLSWAEDRCPLERTFAADWIAKLELRVQSAA